jgi:peptidyl-prolyl cis-trans isomerase D
MVNRNIRSDPRFLDQSGKFSRSRFFQTLSTANMAEGFYVSTLKQSLPSEHLNRAVSGNIPVPKALIDPLTKFRSEQRTARTVLVPPEPLGKAQEPKKEAIDAYYKANKSSFMAPEYRDVTFVHLDPAELAKEVRVAEEKIKESYAQRIDEFTLRDRRKVAQVVFRTEAAATTAAAAIKAGKSLAEVAKEKGKTLKVVKLGWVERKDLFTDLATPVFALKKGTTSGVLKSPLGWHIVTIEDSEKGRVKPLSEVREIVRAGLAAEEAQNSIFKLAQDLEDSLAGGADINAAAAKLNVKAVNVPALDRQGLGRDGKAVANLPIGGNFLRTASEVADGETSTLMETQGGGFYILVVNKVTPPKVKPLGEVRSTAVMAWKAEQQAQGASKRAKAIVARLKKGHKLDAIAKDEKLEVKTSPLFTRLTHEAQSGVPAALTEKLFALKVGEAAIAESAKGYVVGVLASVSAGAGDEKTAVEKDLLQEIRQGLAADLSEQLVKAFRQRFTIKTYPNLLRDRL